MTTQKWAFLGDTQIPYQDNRALRLWFKVMKDWKPDIIDLTGDISDQLCFSRFSDGTTDEFFKQIDKTAAESPVPYVLDSEKEVAKFYQDIRADHPQADIHSSLGNHDIRVFGYMDKKAPEWAKDITPEALWGLDDLGIEYSYYDDVPKKRHADIYVHHGTTTSSTGLAVKKDIEDYQISLVRGHDHRGGVVYKTYPIPNINLVGMGTGHMCDIKAYGFKYTINPSWEKGFGIAHIDSKHVSMQFIKIHPNYSCVVDGRLYKG